MKQNNKINGNGAYLYFGNADHLKFSQKNFKTKLYESEEFFVRTQTRLQK